MKETANDTKKIDVSFIDLKQQERSKFRELQETIQRVRRDHADLMNVIGQN